METGGKEDPLKLGLLSIVARAAFFNTLKTGCIPFFQAQCIFSFSGIFSRIFVLAGCSFQRTPLAVCSPRASQCRGNWRACGLRSWWLKIYITKGMAFAHNIKLALFSWVGPTEFKLCKNLKLGQCPYFSSQRSVTKFAQLKVHDA